MDCITRLMATIASAERSPEAFQILFDKDYFVGNGPASIAVGVWGDVARHARFSGAFDKPETEPRVMPNLTKLPTWADKELIHAVVETCVYRKLKSGRNDGEARRGLGVNESFRPDESDGKSAHPCAETDVF